MIVISFLKFINFKLKNMTYCKDCQQDVTRVQYRDCIHPLWFINTNYEAARFPIFCNGSHCILLTLWHVKSVVILQPCQP
jgi:hypothetical protein